MIFMYRLFSKFIFLLFTSFLFIFLLISSLQAETRYVSDFLVINLRSSIEAPYSIVTRITTGDSLEILAEEGEYLKVKTANEEIGWISKKYTTEDVPKETIIAKLEQQIAALTGSSQQDHTQLIEDNEDLSAKLQEKQQTIDQQKKKIEELTSINKNLKNVDPEKYQEMNKLISDLKNKANQFQQTINSLQADNQQLRDKNRIFWFIAGSLVFLLGLLFGKIPSKRKKKTLSF